ncbi:MAG: hypothetical protein EBZ30_02765 [Flavobacteriia bacterium]|nr:hypothetical protein [Flavobacteriia bacterium]
MLPAVLFGKYSRTYRETYRIMKAHTTLFLLILGASLFSACGLLGPKAPETTAATNLSDSRLQTKFPGYTLTEYQAGEALYQTQCSRCHTLHPASLLVENQWARIIPEMASKANRKAGGEVVTEAGQQAIFRYLYTQGMALSMDEHSH